MTLGRNRLRLATLDLAGRSRQTGSFPLPAGADRVEVAIDPPLHDLVDTITLRRRVETPTNRPIARAALTLERGQFFFLDDDIFVEPDGFWVRGAAQSDSLFVPAGGAVVTLRLANGGVGNVVTVRTGETTREFTLAAGEVERVLLQGDGTPVDLSISSSAGFRPSEGGAGTDARYLGVRVSLE
jgi:hypothetical protein